MKIELVIGVWFDNLPRGATRMQQKKEIIDNELHASVDMRLEHILSVLAKISFYLKINENILSH